jgi:hypothetical protein
MKYKIVAVIATAVFVYLAVRWGAIGAIETSLKFITYGTHFNQF